MWWGIVNFIFYTWHHNVKGQLILILKSAASRPMALFHEVKRNNPRVHSGDGLYYHLSEVQSGDIISVYYDCTVRNDYFLLRNHRRSTESAGRCSHGEKLYVVGPWIIRLYLIRLRHTAHRWSASQWENGEIIPNSTVLFQHSIGSHTESALVCHL